MADLNLIDAEIKKLEQLKDAKMKLLTVEKDINNSILYSTGVRKKYTDALSAAATIQRDLMDKEAKLASRVEETYKLNKKVLRDLSKDTKKRKESLETLRKLGKEKRKDKDAIKKERSTLQGLRDTIKENEEKLGSYAKAMQSVSDEADSLRGNARQLKRTFDILTKIDNQDIKSFEDLNKSTDQRIRMMRMQLNIQEKSGQLSKEENKDLQDKLGSVEEIFSVMGNNLKSKVSDKLGPMVDELTQDAVSKVDPKKFKKDPNKERSRALSVAESQKGISTRMSQLSNLKALVSPRSDLKTKLASAKSVKSAEGDMQKLNEVMKVTGRSALTAGGTMKMLGEALGSIGKLGWIGYIIQAVTAIASAVNQLDKFIKGFNQTFAKLQGPTVMMKDVKKSMREFSDSIFNLQRNLKYGLKSEDLIGMFQGIAESGMSLQGILNNVKGGYGKMIDESAKVSLDFGVSVQEAGAMLGEQMTDLRSSVDDAAKGFKVLSYDASIAGIQSQKFYQATYASAEALSYYGKFLESASTTLKNFQQQGGMGFKDAQKQAQEMTNLFESMDDNSKTAFIEMTGGVEKYRKDFLKLENDSKKAITDHLSVIAAKRKDMENAKAKGDKDTVARIESEIKAEETQLTTSQRIMAQAGIAARSNSQDMATYLGLISDKVGEKMADYFKEMRKNNGPDVFSTNTRAIKEHMKAVLHVSDEFAMKMIGTIQTSQEGIKLMAADLQGLVDKLPEGKDGETFRKDVYDIIQKNLKDGKMDMGAIQKGLSEYGKANNVNVSGIYENLQKFPNAVQEFMKKGYDGVMANIKTITLDEQKQIQQVTGEGDKEQAKRLDDLVKGTHTIEDFLGINADQLKYIAATSPPQELLANAAIATARSTGKIYEFITGRFGKTKEQKKEEQSGKEIEGLLYEQKLLQVQLSKTTDKKTRGEIAREIEGIKDKIDITSGGKASIVAEADIVAEKRAREELQRREDAEANKPKVAPPQERSKPPIIPQGTIAPVKPEGDYKASTGGYALLSKGDVVVNAKSMSTGIGGDLGAFSGVAASEMMKAIGPANASKQVAPSIPVQITIGSVSGDPEEFLKRIKPAIEQAFERMYFDKQKRK